MEIDVISAIITAAGAIIAAVITGAFQVYKRKSKELEASIDKRVDTKTEEEVEKRIRVFDAPPDKSYNLAFYKYFEGKIRGAEQSIYITGEGFDFSSEEGSRIAQSFVDSMKAALNNPSVRMVRVQTKAETSPRWAQLISELLKLYGDRFQFYVLSKGKVAHISSVCVIDPDHSENNVSEIMLSTQRLMGAQASDVAGTAIFIEGKQNLAKNIRQRVLALVKASIQIQTPEEVEKYLVGKQLYFAYGSNMDEEQMKKRCKSADLVGIGVINDHKLVFNRKGTYRPGGVASVEPKDGERVYGIIWKIDLDDLFGLDETEDPNAYKRITMTCHDMRGEKYDCQVYQAFPQGVFEPDQNYLQQVIDAAGSANLPEDYISFLRSFQK